PALHSDPHDISHRQVMPLLEYRERACVDARPLGSAVVAPDVRLIILIAASAPLAIDENLFTSHEVPRHYAGRPLAEWAWSYRDLLGHAGLLPFHLLANERHISTSSWETSRVPAKL